jgi:GAF domain-containing protein
VYRWGFVDCVTPVSTSPPHVEERAEFLRAAAESVRTIFHANAASVLLADKVTGELVFEGVAGEGAENLQGRRIPIDTGIAGSVLASGEPVAVDDVRADPRFATAVAEMSGYVPSQLMATPLVHRQRTLGVVEVFDRPQFSQFSLVELDMLSLFARQLAIGVDLFHGAASFSEPPHSPAERLARVAEQIGGADERRRHAAEGLITELERLFA